MLTQNACLRFYIHNGLLCSANGYEPENLHHIPKQCVHKVGLPLTINGADPGFVEMSCSCSHIKTELSKPTEITCEFCFRGDFPALIYSSPHPVEVGVRVLGHVVVEGDVDSLDVHPSAKQVGGHQDPPLEIFELLVARQSGEERKRERGDISTALFTRQVFIIMIFFQFQFSLISVRFHLAFVSFDVETYIQSTCLNVGISLLICNSS